MSEHKPKKRTWMRVLLLIAGGWLGCGVLLLVLRKIGIFIMGVMLAMLLLVANGDMDELIFTTDSPGGSCVLEVYRVNPGATEPFYIRCDVLEVDQSRRTVYKVRGQDEAEIIWLSDTVAQINGVPVDVTSGDCFKADARGYFAVTVQVKAEDVSRLEMTVCMDGEPRVTQHRTSVPLTDETDAWGHKTRLNVLQELHWDDDLTKKQAGLIVAVDTADGKRILLPYRWEWTAEVYGNYTFTLTGSAQAGYTLVPEGLKCTVTRLEEAHD